MKRESRLYLIAIACGIAVWVLVSAGSGRREAWDAPGYFSVGIPLICVVSLALGYAAPKRSWRWGITPIAAQFVWTLLTQGFGNLFPLGVLMFAVLALPPILTARLGAFLATRTRKH